MQKCVKESVLLLPFPSGKETLYLLKDIQCQAIAVSKLSPRVGTDLVYTMCRALLYSQSEGPWWRMLALLNQPKRRKKQLCPCPFLWPCQKALEACAEWQLEAPSMSRGNSKSKIWYVLFLCHNQVCCISPPPRQEIPLPATSNAAFS